MSEPSGYARTTLSRWVDAVRRAAAWVVALSVLSVFGAVYYTSENLGMNTDTADMISKDLPWRQTYMDYQRSFPQYTDTLLLVIDGATPESAAQGAERLAADLRAGTDLVEWVYAPGSDPFFQRYGLLYLDSEELGDLADNLARVQPFLAVLAQDPTLRGFFDLIGRALDAEDTGQDLDLEPVLERVAAGVTGTLDGRSQALSWQELMLGRDATPGDKRAFVLVKPKLDYGDLLPAGPAMDRIRARARALGLVPEKGVRVRITGGTALSHEELLSVSRGAEIAGVIVLVLVGIVLFVGLGSPRLVFASLVTLLIGLVWTALFATVAVGHLNLISVAFAVLYIGLGVAYAIHFCLRYRELVRLRLDHAEALRVAAGDVGGALVLCALTTGIGFYAFVPTDYAGVSELGLISGTGMFIGLAASLTVLPALLTLMPLSPEAAPPLKEHRPAPGALSIPYRHRRAVLAGAGLAAVAAASVLPWAQFDHNPLNLRDPATESVATYLDLLADSDSSPWSGVVMVEGSAQAKALKSRLEALDVVDSTRSIDDFVPRDQNEKLDLVEEISLLLGPQLDPAAESPGIGTAARRQALADLLSRLRSRGDEAGHATAAPLLEALTRLQERLAGLDEDKARALLKEVESALLGTLPYQLARLRTSLDADVVAFDDIPPGLMQRWVAADGRQRIEVFPSQDLNDNAALRRFVTQVRAVAPGFTDSPVTILESGDAVVRAFQHAVAWALGLITLVLLVLFRRLRDVVLVLAPLLLGGLLTVSGMVIAGISFNFANVIALPLLLGVGVDNGIHMVSRVRSAAASEHNILHTSTARAVVISALTTICSFGNLALSAHVGTASMGQMLTIGMIATLLCTLIVLPAMLGRNESSGC